MNAYEFHFLSLFIPFIAIYREGDIIVKEKGRMRGRDTVSKQEKRGRGRV